MDYKCLRCNRVWKPRKSKKPRVCPRCKSPYWDIPVKSTKSFVEHLRTLIIGTHDKIIEKSGGAAGTRDAAGVYNAAYKVSDYMSETRLPEKVGAFVFEDLAKRHHFVDGNKRTAYCVTKIVLIVLDHHLKLDYKTAVPFIIKIARHDKPVSQKEIERWLKKHIIKIQAEKKDIYLKEVLYDIYDERGEL